MNRLLPATRSAARRARGLLLGIGLAAAALSLQPGLAHGQIGPAPDGFAIAAVVNDDLISHYDIQARMQLALAVSNIEDTEETRRRLRPQVLRQLIDERLQMQEAKRLNITVSDQEVREAVAVLERQNNLPPGALEGRLQQDGVPFSTLISQVRANLAWGKIIRRQIRPQVEIGEEEIDEYLDMLRARGGGAEYELSEIFIPIDSTAEEAAVAQTAQRVVQQARSGVPFASLAQQFSQAASATQGGDLGRVQEGQLDRRVDAALREMRVGEVSDPIRVENGYYILQLRDRRQRTVAAAPAARSGNDSVALRRIFLPLAQNAGPDETRRQGERARTVSEAARGCDDMEQLAPQVGATGAVDVGRLRVADLPDALRRVVEQLPVGKASPPIRLPDGVMVLMVCDRSEGPAQAQTPPAADPNLPSREEIARNLGMQRIDMLSRRYMRDLRRAAFIDVRA